MKLCLVVILSLFSAVNSQCGAEMGWDGVSGYKTVVMDGKGLFLRNSGDVYTNLTSCLCQQRCRSDSRCRKWVLVPRYLGNTTLLTQECDNPDLDKNACGWSASCVLKEESVDVYTGEMEPTIESGFLPRISGAHKCSRPSFPCRSRQCCEAGQICNTFLGCQPIPGKARILSDSPYDDAVFLVPLVLGIFFVIVAILITLNAGIFWSWSRKPRSPWERDIIHILMELAALVFILSDFGLAFHILTKINVDDYRAAEVTNLGGDTYDANTVFSATIKDGRGGRPFACLIKTDHLIGQTYPITVQHLGKFDYISAAVTEPVWATWFQVVMYLLCPLQLALHLCFSFHKIWLGYKAGRGVKLGFLVWFYLIFSDVFGALENGFMLDPTYRAWNLELFESVGMPIVYRSLMVGFFLTQLAFIAIVFYLYSIKNFSFLTLQRYKVRKIDWTSFFLFIYPCWYTVMIILTFIYKFTTPSGPGRVRVWYFYLLALVCHLIKHVLASLCSKMNFTPPPPTPAMIPVVPKDEDDPFSLTAACNTPKTTRRGRKN